MREGSQRTKTELKWAELQADIDSDTLTLSLPNNQKFSTIHEFLNGEGFISIFV